MERTDVCYLTFPTESNDQASSLANYLKNHGLTAAADRNEVVCPLEGAPDTSLHIRLHENWKLYWQHSDAELYGLPVFIKPSDYCQADR